MAAAVTSAAPVTFVSNTRRHVSASVSTSRANGPMPGVYTSASMPPRSAAAFPMADATDASSVTSHSMRERARPGLGRGRLEPLTPAGEQRHLRTALAEADPDAATEPARRSNTTTALTDTTPSPD